jgi:4-hydroxy-tetrahydrodipicolinate synthase
VGAVGVISVASHWVGTELGEMVRLYLKGDVEGARELNAGLIDAVSFQSSDEAPNPLPAKAVLRVLGLPAGECRLPMGNAPDWLEPKARSMLANLGSWRSSRPARAKVTSPDA